METTQLMIPAMKSPHCMMTVAGAIKTLKGVNVKKISPGVVEIELSEIAKNAVIKAIEKAGYTVSDI
jgi:copper chaperone CopZ